MISSQSAVRAVSLAKALAHFERYGLVSVVAASKKKSSAKNNETVVEGLDFGPAGHLVLENLRREWFRSQVHFRDENVFVFTPSGTSRRKENIVEDIKGAFKFAKEACGGQLPFGLAETKEVEAEAPPRTPSRAKVEPQEKENLPEERLLWRVRKYTRLRYLAVAAPQGARQFFYSWQHARKRWWRMLSAEPGRFSFADAPADSKELPDDGVGEEVKILASFDWGQHCLETACYHGAALFQNLDIPSQNLFSIRANGKRCPPHLVEFSCNLELGAFTYIADCLKDRKPARSVCMFHRKLAPYKFAFAAPPMSSSDELDELKSLCRCLGLDLRKHGLTALLPSPVEFGKKALSHQVTFHDGLGVPYVLVVRPETLKTGIAGLRGRDTTLEEEVHVGKFIEYAEILMKNY